MAGKVGDTELWQDVVNGAGEYLEKAERLLYRRLYGYIIDENWDGVGKVVDALRSLSLI